MAEELIEIPPIPSNESFPDRSEYHLKVSNTVYGIHIENEYITPASLVPESTIIYADLNLAFSLLNSNTNVTPNLNPTTYHKYYLVNDKVFLDMEPKMINDKVYHDYYLTVSNKELKDAGKKTDELTMENLSEALPLKMQGVGGNVFWKFEYWHTIENEKINDNLLCGVCNKLFTIQKYRKHENSKSHEINLFTAINKVSDQFMRHGKKITQMLNTNTVQAPNDAKNAGAGNADARNADAGKADAGNADARNADAENADARNRSHERWRDADPKIRSHEGGKNADAKNVDPRNRSHERWRNADPRIRSHERGKNADARNADDGNRSNERRRNKADARNANDGNHSNERGRNKADARNTDVRNRSHERGKNADETNRSHERGRNTDLRNRNYEWRDADTRIRSHERWRNADLRIRSHERGINADARNADDGNRSSECRRNKADDGNRSNERGRNKADARNADAANRSQELGRSTDPRNRKYEGRYADTRNRSHERASYTDARNANANADSYADVASRSKDRAFNALAEKADDRNRGKELSFDITELDYTLPKAGVSYASMASKPKLNTQKFLNIDLGIREVIVTYESWNMIKLTDENKFYCMICKESYPITIKNQHCIGQQHQTILSKCTLVGAFEDHFIRDIDSKVFHCGHCNKLEYKNDMQFHVKSYHQNKSCHQVKSYHQVKNQPLPKADVVSTSVASVPGPKIDIYGDCKFSIFGKELVVSNLGCHTLMKVNDGMMCALCDVKVVGDLADHVITETHTQYMYTNPYMKMFRGHLTRAIRGYFHCTHCNDVIKSDIYFHNISQAHVTLMANATVVVKSEVKRKIDVPPREFQTDLDRFLAVLPKNTKKSLGRLKIKNHKGNILQMTDTSAGSSPDCTAPMSITNTPTHSYKDSFCDETARSDPFANPLTSEGASHSHWLDSAHDNIQIKYPKGGVAGIIPNPTDDHPFDIIKTEQELLSMDMIRDLSASPLKTPEEVELENELRSLFDPVPVKRSESDEMITEIEIIRYVPEKKIGSYEDSSEDPDVLDDPVYMKVDSQCWKVTNASYHTLVHLGDGVRYCFVCSDRLDYKCLQEHIDSPAHTQNIEKNTFLSNYGGGPLFRQMYLSYHCILCNLTMSRTEIETHTKWQTHIDKHRKSITTYSAKRFKYAHRAALRARTVTTQKVDDCPLNVGTP